MNVWGWLILFVAILLAVVGLFSSVITIHTYFESRKHPMIKKSPTRASILFIVGTFILALILTPLSVLIIKASTQVIVTPTPRNDKRTVLVPTPIPTLTPTATSLSPSALYHIDFSQGGQGWITNSTSSQWTYNTATKLLESNGSLSCCSPTTLKQVVVAAPYTLQKENFAVEARIRVTAIPYPYSHDYANGTQPFFGLYVRGTGLNQQGYMIGLGYDTAGDKKTRSYLVALANNPAYHDGGEYSGLDHQWHTYRVEVQGASFSLFVDNKQINSNPLVDDQFSVGTQVGIEDYDNALQVQTFSVYPP